ncbi:MAG: putative ABC transport system ATP-binding protein [Bacillota bacterium]|nr:MAG: putative ABC transport system ATP-binding protein [Bacillota bacterium]
MQLVNCISLHKEYCSGKQVTHAVRGVSLEINKGESIAITGPSGCGKTTLLNMVGLIVSPTFGDLLIQGLNTKSFSNNKLSALRSKFFGYIVQDFALIEDYTALENAEIPLLYGPERLGRNERRKRVHEALSRVDLDSKMHEEVRNLSGGQRQRVAIARALVSDPQVILADEPTGSLDSQTGHEVFRLLMELVQEGRTLLLVTHNLDLAQHCERRVNMVDGCIV